MQCRRMLLSTSPSAIAAAAVGRAAAGSGRPAGRPAAPAAEPDTAQAVQKAQSACDQMLGSSEPWRACLIACHTGRCCRMEHSTGSLCIRTVRYGHTSGRLLTVFSCGAPTAVKAELPGCCSCIACSLREPDIGGPQGECEECVLSNAFHECSQRSQGLRRGHTLFGSSRRIVWRTSPVNSAQELFTGCSAARRLVMQPSHHSSASNCHCL